MGDTQLLTYGVAELCPACYHYRTIELGQLLSPSESEWHCIVRRCISFLEFVGKELVNRRLLRLEKEPRIVLIRYSYIYQNIVCICMLPH